MPTPRRHRAIVAAAAAALLAYPARGDVVNSTWQPDATGQWTEASLWANSPAITAYPNNGLSGSTFYNYNATLNSGVITLDRNITLSQLTLNGGSITASGTSGLSVSDLTLGGGTLAAPATVTTHLYLANPQTPKTLVVPLTLQGKVDFTSTTAAHTFLAKGTHAVFDAAAAYVTFNKPLTFASDTNQANLATLTIGSNFYQNGTLDVGTDWRVVNTGTLSSTAPVTLRGDYSAPTGSLYITKSLDFTGQTFQSGKTFAITASARANLAPSTGTISGSLSVASNSFITLAPGTAFNLTNLSVTNNGAIYLTSVTYASNVAITGTGTLTIRGGTLSSSNLTLPADRSIDLISGSAIVFDLQTSPGLSLSAVRDRIISGRADGAWNGPGITSTSAQYDPRTAVGYATPAAIGLSSTDTWRGVPLPANTILVRNTLRGDATLDGVVDFNDLTRLAQNYNTSLPTDGDTWAKGDFNLDGVVDFNDLTALAQNYNTALLGRPAPLPQDFQSAFSQAMASVPEPANVALLFPVVIAIRRSTRRQSRASAQPAYSRK